MFLPDIYLPRACMHVKCLHRKTMKSLHRRNFRCRLFVRAARRAGLTKCGGECYTYKKRRKELLWQNSSE